MIGAVSVIRDITDRKKVEKELSDSRDFLAQLFDTSMEGLVVSDVEGYITMVNNKATEMLAYAKDELIGKHFADFGLTLAGEKEKAKKIIEEFLIRGVLTAVERTWKRRDGSTMDVEMNIYQIKDTAGNIVGAMSSFRDIGIRKKADMAIRISEERYRRIFENSFVALQEIDISPLMSTIDNLKSAGMKDMRAYLQEHPEFLREAIGLSTLLETNEAALKLYGARDKDELLRCRDKCLREESAQASLEALISFAEGKRYFQAESIHYTIQGIQKNVLLQMSFLIKRRDLNRLLINIVDITQVKTAEKKLLDYQQQLRSLTNELSEKEENERRNLGMYLHDRIGQSLSVLKMQLEMLASELAGSDDRDKCKSILKTIDQTIHDTRVLSYELSPVILHELGLEVALSWLAEQTEEQYNIAVAFKSDKKAMRLDDGLKIILYRSVHELLNNVVKHAWAQHVAVSIKRSNGQVQITVEDDGVGFDPTKLEGIAATERGFGLFSIRERLHYLGGSILIESALYKGTRITLLVPLK
jgi:PAS domain S-box-containing protein